MKLKNLTIVAYNHLENLNFDFTYPEGHENEGKPLNNICIVGQSATGKTNILELVKNNFSKLHSIEVIQENFVFQNYRLEFKGSIEYVHEDLSFIFHEDKIIRNGNEIRKFDQGGGAVGRLVTDNLKLIYFSSDLISKEAANIFNQNPINILNILSDKNQPTYLNFSQSNFIYEFIQTVEPEIWFSLLYKILDYRKKFTQMASELINKGSIGDISKLNKHYCKMVRSKCKSFNAIC